MIILTFELLVKRIAPVPGLPANAGKEAPFRRIVQGYLLTISNPSLTRAVTFRIRGLLVLLPIVGSEVKSLRWGPVSHAHWKYCLMC